MKLYYEKAELPGVTTLSEATIDEEIRQGRFPKPKKIDGKNQWLFDDLVEWAKSRPVASFAPMPTELYRHFDERGRLLYIGISLSTTVRLMAHMGHASWADKIKTITIQRYPTREEAEDAERSAIRAEKPLHNKVHANKR